MTISVIKTVEGFNKVVQLDLKCQVYGIEFLTVVETTAVLASALTYRCNTVIT